MSESPKIYVKHLGPGKVKTYCIASICFIFSKAFTKFILHGLTQSASWKALNKLTLKLLGEEITATQRQASLTDLENCKCDEGRECGIDGG